MPLAPPLNLQRWVEEHRDLLRPPVGNKRLWVDRETIVMIVGGPNGRSDYHIDPGEELFYQLEGDITLRVIDDGERRDIAIREGELFLLPAGVPHSPQRPDGTVGLVVERARRPGERDGLRWYCERCCALIHERSFELVDIERQLADAIATYRAREDLRTCPACGVVAPA